MSPYWSYYEPAKPKEVKNGLKAKSIRGCIGETWWSKRWVKTLESFNLGARLTRGKSYARKGQVVSIDVNPGIVRARVQGTGSEPYDVVIKLKPLSDAEWDKAASAMASKAVFAARLLGGEMPQNIEEAFSESGLSLFPSKGRDLKTDCSCPDWSNPCKHIAAVYYLLAEQFDCDPFLIFKLRGRSKEDIMEAMRKMRSAEAVEEADGISRSSQDAREESRALEECLECYWQSGGELDLLEVNPRAPDVEGAVLKRLGQASFYIAGVNLAALLPKAYEKAGKAALLRATGETESIEMQ
ncbi:MAG: SWIM zinc finger family protein [Methanothrix sp.]|uniref:SWIM zinc finger family protein n=1 Tax=Methanothrix sp. TaxID=90426 RepID=UPI003BB56E02